MLTHMETMAATSAVPGDANEAALVNSLRVGDPTAFALLVQQNCGRMLAVARRILGNEEDAHEAVQDAFLNAFRGIAHFDASARLATWLHRITVNSALMKLRTRQRKHEPLIDDLLPKFAADGHQAEPAVEWRQTSEAALQRQETRDLVRKTIDQLPENYRIVLLLRDIEEMDTEETARFLGVTEGVVKTRLHRARQALRALLDPHFRGGSL
jgi:RNA polymerase sigma-70 factor (ECF subfamily)